MPEDKRGMTKEVTENSGYSFEARQTSRVHDGWGATQTRLPEGHLARRDAKPEVKRTDK